MTKIFDFDKEQKRMDEYIEYEKQQPEFMLPRTPWDFQVTMPEFQLGKLIPARSIGMLFGPSNSGKSHLICDIIRAHLQDDNQWQGQTFTPGDVVMFSESLGHVQARLKAYITHAGKAIKNNIYLNPTQGFETVQVQSLGVWIESLDKPPMMVVFDTLATAFQFEENDNKEASRLIKMIEDNIVPKLDPCGCVVIVHHTSKASEGRSARGASALIGNIDWSVQVVWDKDIGRTVASWEKDRWRLADKSPQWAGEGFRVLINFTNGQAEMTVVEWQEYSDELIEATRQLREDVKMDSDKNKVYEAVRLSNKPLYIHSNRRARVPTGYVPFQIKGLVANQNVPAMHEYIRDKFETETVMSERGIETGFIVVDNENSL